MGRLLTLLRPKGEWTPKKLPGLALWLDASDLSTITHDAGAVSQWDDKSSNGYHVAQGTASEQPVTGTRTQGGRNVIDFAGDDRLLRGGVPILKNVQHHSVFMVFGRDAASGRNDLLYITTATTFARLLLSSNLVATDYTATFRRLDADSGVTAGGGTVDANPHVMRSTANFVNGTVSAHLDGAELGTGVVTTGSTSDTNASNLVVGATFGVSGTNFLDGFVAEVIVYEAALTAQQVGDAEIYLASKWGVALA